MEWLAQISMSLAGLVLMTNALVEVLKQVTWGKIPTNLLVVLVAEGITLCYIAVLAGQFGAAVTWRMAVGGVVVGLLVAYGAMFGFDKLRQLLDQLTSLGGTKGGPT